MTLIQGATHSLKSRVTPQMAASIFATRPGENYPPVLGTPHLIGELERVCADMLVPLLTAGKVSVGVSVSVEHTAPTPVGAEINSHARFIQQAGKLFWFEVWTEDPAGSVGRGKHARAIVDLAAIESRAGQRHPATATA